MTPARWRTTLGLLLGLQAVAVTVRPAAGLRAATSGPDGLVAPTRLVDTGLYEDGRVGVIADGNRPFSPQYPLWTDGAAKSRWIYLPEGSAIDATDPYDWSFPVGTRFWKEFRFNNRPVETRFIWRATSERWVFASYAWNESGTEATLAPAGGLPNVARVSPASSRRHSIPAVTDCQACHGHRDVEPLGFNVLQLSVDRDPNAPHGEPLTDAMWTVRSLVDAGRLRTASGAPIDDRVRINGDDTTRTALGYLSTNCGSCHRSSADIVRLGAPLGHRDVIDAQATTSRMLAHRTLWQVPGLPEGDSRLIDTRVPDDSALLRRMRSRQPSSQMPPLGTVVADEQAIALIRGWIAQSQ